MSFYHLIEFACLRKWPWWYGVFSNIMLKSLHQTKRFCTPPQQFWFKHCLYLHYQILVMYFLNAILYASLFLFRQYWQKRSEHTDRNVELKRTVVLRTTPTHLEISHYMVLPQIFPYHISIMQSFKSYLNVDSYRKRKRNMSLPKPATFYQPFGQMYSLYLNHKIQIWSIGGAIIQIQAK